MKEGFHGQRMTVLSSEAVRMLHNDRLLKALHITDIGYFPSASFHEIHRRVGVEQYVFIYCVRGKGWYEVEGKHYDIVPNQYFIIPKGKAHDYGADRSDPWTIYWIHFGGTLAGCYAENAVEPKNIKPELHSRINNRQNIFEEIYSTMSSSLDKESLQYASSLFHYYLGSLRYIHHYRNAIHPDRDMVTEDQDSNISVVEALIHYMKENKEKHLTLKQMADYTGYSVSHLSMIFRRDTGKSPIEYFNYLKVKDACWMLDNTDMRINQICYKLGIDDAYYFSRMFSKMIGISPKLWRERKSK